MLEVQKPQTFVLIHGAWHGAWCWQSVAMHLVARGNRVLTPTLKGLGERADQLDGSITLHTFIEEIAEYVTKNELGNVVLVGHSFAGAVIAGVADRIAPQLQQLIYLDAAVLDNGESLMNLLPQATQDKRIAEAKLSTCGLALPTPPPTDFGLNRPQDVAFVEDKLTPHPLKTYLSKLEIKAPLGAGLPVDYIACTNPPYPAMKASLDRALRANWTIHELDTGHDAMIMEPEKTADLLEKIAHSHSNAASQ